MIICLLTDFQQTEKSTQPRSTATDDDVKFMMDKFGLDEEKARMAIEKGFRVEALRDGSAMGRFVEDSGIASGIARVKAEFAKSTESSREGSRG